MRYTNDRQFLAPVPLSCNAVFVGDSNTSEVSAGQYATQLASRYNWTILGRTDPVVNGQVEANITGWNSEANCTLAWDASCPGISDITGAHALKVVATAASTLTLWDCGGTTGAMRLNMAAGAYQTFGAAVWLQASFTGNCYVQIIDRIGAGAYNFTNSNLVSAASGVGVWLYLAVVRNLPAGTTEAYVRFVMDSPRASETIWVDGAYIVHTNGLVTPAIGGASLATSAACGNTNSILDNFTARVAAYSAPVYLLFAGTNDWFEMTDQAWVTAHGGPLYTPVQWGVAVRAAITQILALAGSPQLYVFGLPPANALVPNMGRLPSYAVSGNDLRNQMDAQTRAACMENHVPFIKLSDLPPAYTDGIHVDASLLGTGQLGHTWMAQRFQDTLNRAVR